MSRREGVCRRCGYTGEGVGTVPVFPGCQCPRCCSALEFPVDWWRVLCVIGACLVSWLLLLLLLSLLGGCGKEFTADGGLLDASIATDAAPVPSAAGGNGGALPEPGAAGASPASAGQAGASPAGGAPAGGMGGDGAGGAAPCDLAGWRATAFASDAAVGSSPSAALDGSEDTRWASGEPQALGQWFSLELPPGVVLEQLELETTAGDMPRGLELDVDGAPPPATSAAASSPGVLVFAFGAPTPARMLRLTITQPMPAPAWWTIRELRAVCR